MSSLNPDVMQTRKYSETDMGEAGGAACGRCHNHDPHFIANEHKIACKMAVLKW